MKITRIFAPIGQGGFSIEKFEGININVVYDCGSDSGNNGNIIKREIKRAFHNKEKIHAVYISHFHQDHINGLPFLLEYCSVKNVYFPYLAEEEVIVSYSQLMLGNSDASTISFLTDPVGNIKEVSPDTNIHLILPSNLEGIDGYTMEGRLPESHPWASNLNASALELQMHFSGRMIVFDRTLEWEYIPFNFRNIERKELFIQLLKEYEIPLDSLNDIKKYLHTEKNRHQLREIYKKVTGDLNINSMVVYSGHESWISINDINCSDLSDSWNTCCLRGRNYKQSGCLYMGDYNASGFYEWKELYEKFEKYWDNIGLLQLPHHGSKYNFNPQFLNMSCIFIIFAGYTNRYSHPHHQVIKDLLVRKKRFSIITEDKRTRISISYGKR